MSVINKKPFIASVVESLTKEQLASLNTLLNGASTTIFRSYLNTSYPFSTSDKGVSHCVFEAKDKVFTGYLLYNNSYCVLVAYEGKSQKLKMLKLDYANDKYEIVNEELDIEEFRRVVENVAVNVTIEGNDVSANPELAGTESVLTGIEIDGTKYRNYKPAYCHPLQLGYEADSENVYIDFYIFDDKNSAYTLTNIFEKLIAMKTAGKNPMIGAVAQLKNKTTSKFYMQVSIMVDEANERMTCYFLDGSNGSVITKLVAFNSFTSLSDSFYQINS